MNTGNPSLSWPHKKMHQAGLSLIEVMVSLAILGVVTMGAVSMGGFVADQSRMNRVSNNVFQVFESIRAGTLMEETCSTYIRDGSNVADVLNFRPNIAERDGIAQDGLPITFMVPGVRGLGAQPVNHSGAPFNELTNLGLTVTTLQLTNAMHIDDGDPADPQRYLAYLELGLDRPTGYAAVLGGKSIYRKRIVTALYIETDSPNANAPGDLISCRSASSNMDQQQLCENLGPKWTWNATETPPCQAPSDPLQCDPGQVLTKVENGVATCKDIGIDDQGCTNADEFIVELGVEHILCARPPEVIVTPAPAATCPPQVVNWSEGANNCSGNLVASLVNGGFANISDPTPGSVTVTCSNGSLIQSGATCGGTPVPPITPVPSPCPAGFTYRNPSPYGGTHACIISVPDPGFSIPSSVSAQYNLGATTRIRVNYSGASPAPYYCPPGFVQTATHCEAIFTLPAAIASGGLIPYNFADNGGTVGIAWNLSAYPESSPNPCPPYMARSVNSPPTNGFCSTHLTALWDGSYNDPTELIVGYNFFNQNDPAVASATCPPGLTSRSSAAASGYIVCAARVPNPYPNSLGPDANITFINNFSRYSRRPVPFGTAVIGFYW